MADWNQFYRWLSSDSDSASSEYKNIRQKLINFFRRRSCPDPEGLADAAIERVVNLLPKCGDRLPIYPLRYCYGVASFIHKEYLSRVAKLDGGELKDDCPAPYNPGMSADQELLDRCLSICLQKLDPERRNIFTRYYLVEPSTGPKKREALAEELKITINALRLQMLRLKGDLRKCIADCLEREAPL